MNFRLCTINNSAHIYSNVSATMPKAKAKIVRNRGINTRRTGILHYCGQGRPSQLLRSSCFISMHPSTHTPMHSPETHTHSGLTAIFQISSRWNDHSESLKTNGCKNIRTSCWLTKYSQWPHQKTHRMTSDPV